jgi:riboflavin kinase/FMN adenylyltransferase
LTPPLLQIEVLGSGTSTGVPTIGCRCAVCTSSDPRDRRLRPSVLIRYNGRNILIDCGPDFRHQALRARIDRLDAILFTHAHADHILGLDDVRPFNFRQKAPIPIWGSRETIATIRQVFRYIFETIHTHSTIPRIETNVFGDDPFEVAGLLFQPVPVLHGNDPVTGFRFGSAAYLTDHSAIPDASLELLRDLDVVFVDGLRHREHPTHSTVKQALANLERLRPRRGYLTHISHDLPHAETERTLPAYAAIAYDRLRIETAAHAPPRIYRSLERLDGFGPCALTIGNFDGVHRGHRELMRRVANHAAFRGWRAAVLTFDPHPAKIVSPERAPRLLTTVEERCRLMAAEGIDRILVLPFDKSVSRLSPEEFAVQILSRKLRVQHVIVGEDFRFGHNQAGDAALLMELGRRYGFTVEPIRKVDIHRHHISSTSIRRHLECGNVAEATHELGRPYALEGEVVRGRGVGSTQTVPTLNIAWTAEIIPARGVYVTRAQDFHSTRTWPAVTNIGFRPTFDGEGLSIETYLLEPLEAHPPRCLRVEFLHRLRAERKFDRAEELKQQILRDVERAKAFHRRLQRWVERSAVATIESDVTR